MVDCTGFENRQTETSQGFESLSLRRGNFGRLGVCAGLKILRTWFDSTRFHNIMRCSPAATRADCKSAAIRLRGFESRHLNDGSIVQLVECRSPKPKVGDSNPSASAKSRDRVVAQLTSLISWAGQKPDAGSNPAPATIWSL